MVRALVVAVLVGSWLVQGLVAAAEPPLTRLTIAPPEVVLAGARAQQRLLVTGHHADGSQRDLTGACQFQSSQPEIVAVNEAGVLRPGGNGSARITISHQGVQESVTVRMERLQDNAYNFRRDVLPVLSRLGCNQMGCHGSPRGKAGFRLSLFGADPQGDYETITHGGLGRLVSPQAPAESLLLLKGTGMVAHGGDVRLKPHSGEHRLLLDWIAQGSPRGSDQDPTLTRIEVFPSERVLALHSVQPVLVEAHYSDGTMADVTHLASLVSSDDQIVAFPEPGRAEAVGTGEAVVVVSYAGRVAVARLLVPQVRSTPYPQVAVNNRIDELILARWRLLNLVPSELSGDAEFLRRVYLDVLGILPTPEEARAFLQDMRPDRRNLLIDSLLTRSELVDAWTLKWGDLLRINRSFPINLGEKSMLAYHQWVRDSIAANKPINQFARELLTAQGDSGTAGPANFFRVARDPQGLAEQTATVFLGIRLDCAHCHNHPFEPITWDDNYGLAAFFAQVKTKRGSSKDDEMVSVVRAGSLRHAGTGAAVQPRFLDGKVPSLPAAKGKDVSDLRPLLADWITAPENPWFARNLVNRLWAWTMGRGLVHEPDDFRSTNPPSHPEVLDYLARELVDSGYNMKHVLKLILQSRTYQLSARPTTGNEQDRTHFSHYALRRLSAEQLLDAISQATGVAEKFPKLPAGTRAAQLPDGNIRSPFLDAFGRPKRAQTCECERSSEMHVGQTLQLLSSDLIEARLTAPNGRVATLLRSGKNNEALIEELYLATLSRFPTPGERTIALAALPAAESRQQWVQDLLWTLMNTKEFLFNH